MDETARFYSLMPNKTLKIKGESQAGRCEFKNWLTTLLCWIIKSNEKFKH
jgi:hypothetical protein